VAAGRQAQAALQVLADSGWQPDILLCSPGSGLPLFLDRVFPDAFRVCCAGSGLLRGLSQADEDRRMVSLAIHSAVLAHSHKALSFFPLSCLPFPLAGAFEEMRPTVDTAFFSREAAVSTMDGLGEELVTLDTRGCSGIGTELMVAIMGLLLHRPACHVLFLCAAPQIAEQVKAAFDGLAPTARDRVHVREGLTRFDLCDLFSASSLCLWPEGGVMPVDCLCAMSCGTPLLAPADAVRPLLEDVVAVLPQDRDGMFRTVSRLLDSPSQRAELGRLSRLAVQEHFDRKTLLPGYVESLLEACRAHRAAESLQTS
jgi:glycosyltransferase involved in cell wall biosynthesis